MKKLILILTGAALMIFAAPIYSFSQSSNETGKAKTSVTEKDATKASNKVDCTKICPEAKTCHPDSKAKACCSKAKIKDAKNCDPAKCPEAKNCNPANCKPVKSCCSKSGKKGKK